MLMDAMVKHADGHMDYAGHISKHERMDFVLFKQVYGGHLMTEDEVSQHKIRRVHEGFSPWIDKHGRIFAVRRED